jgi:hypothetical protein
MVKRLPRSFIIVERYGKKPLLVKGTGDRRKDKVLARELSGVVSDVAWVVDTTCCLYKGGELRVFDNTKLKKVV